MIEKRKLHLLFALAVAATAAPRWPDPKPLAMPFRPHDKKICQQNPPDFSWPEVREAKSYELQVARDAGFERVGHRKAGLATNFHNFPHVFESGTWYWRVRFQRQGEWSEWTGPRRFRIDPEARPFPVPDIEALIKSVPAGHPRIWTNEADLKNFRARARGPRNEWFAALEKQVRAEMATPPASEPLFPYPHLPNPMRTPEWMTVFRRLRSEGEGAAERMLRTAFVYLVTGDASVGTSAVAQMMNMARWNPNGPTSYRNHDQVHRAVAWKTAVAYDWCHELLSREQREIVLAMVRTRTLTMFGHLVEERPLTRMPYDSHGWTAYGYLGIIAAATLGDLPDAAHWFRSIVPSYINLFAPWGDEDGGWCQGMAYWRYSQQFGRKFMDALLSATGVSLYNKAHARASGLFPLYMLPHGSPRAHFGDGTDHKPGAYEVQHYQRLAQIYRDPVLQWAWQAIGNPRDSRLQYYFSGDDTLPAAPPKDLPRARWFRDIDWAAMHSDLADPERVSLYFKSSPIGSISHSHGDQNGFVLNAFGEALAIDSGYYDWYNSPHDANYTRQTLAHNAVTYRGGLGQPIFDPTAKGRITGFVTGDPFDAVTGDATDAYKGALAKAVRHIVYVRPRAFVVIDDLATGDGKPSTYEWRLHALSGIRPDQDSRGATVEQGKARLSVRFHEPARLAAEVGREFIGPPSVYPAGAKRLPFLPGGYSVEMDQVHAAFITPEAPAMRIVATMQASKVGTAIPEVRAEREGGVLALRFPEGERVMVRQGARGFAVSGGVGFDGVACGVSGDSLLLVQGTRLERDGKPLLEADKPVTAVLGPGTLSISCGDDTEVKVNAPGVVWVRDIESRRLERERWSAAGGTLTLRLEPAWHSLQFGSFQ